MSDRYETDTVMRIETNLDDCTGEALGAAMEALFAGGALDVWFTPIQMKKHRPGVLLSVLCEPARAAALSDLVFQHTTAFGLRQEMITRVKLARRFETVSTEFGGIAVKVGTKADGTVVQIAPEFENCREAAEAHGVTFAAVHEAALRGFR